MLYGLLIKQFLRSRIAITGISFLLIAGIVSLFIGKAFVEKQQRNIIATAAYQQKHIESTVQFENKELGLLLYYLRFAYVNSIHQLNGLSIGQRDVNLGIQQVTIRNLEEKKYDTDLNNPASLVMGNLDFSFVLIYLFPLVIITFTFNLLSEEKEEGTWRLLELQSGAPGNVLFKKLLVRFGFVIVSLLLLYLLVIPILKVPITDAYLAIVCSGILYTGFWFALCTWVVSRKKSSPTNAVSLLSIWLLLTIVAPSALNSFITTRYPVPEAFATVVANRDGFHRKWDEPKETTMERFYTHYPQLKRYTLPKKEFNWLWYYAMQQMGDDDALSYSTAMRTKLLKRNETSSAIAYFVPTLHTQLQLSSLTQSDLKNQIDFLDSTTAFHERKRLYFYPKIFEDFPVLQEDWKKHYPVAYYEEPVQVDWFTLILPPIILITIFSMLAYKTFISINRNL